MSQYYKFKQIFGFLQKHRANRLSYKRYNYHKFGSAGMLNKSIITSAKATQYSAIPHVPSTTINPIYEYSEEKVAIAEHDFQCRRNHLWKMCSKYEFIDRYPPNAWEFFISPGHGIAWCNVFKAASSTMMFYFNILGKLYNLQCLIHFHPNVVYHLHLHLQIQEPFFFNILYIRSQTNRN